MARARGLDRQTGIVERQRALDVDGDGLAVLLELLPEHGAALETPADAVVREQIARHLGPRMAREIVRRADHCDAQVYVATEDIVPLLTLRRERSEQEYMDFMRARFMPSA